MGETHPVTVGEILAVPSVAEAFSVLAGASSLARMVGQRTVQRLGVALTGYTEHLERDRIQMMGRSEHGFLATLDPQARAELLARIVDVGFPALVLTCGLPVPTELLELAGTHDLTLIGTPLESPSALERLNEVLTQHLTPTENVHGVLVDVYGVGVLLTGRSGVGKSEVALELIAHGHRLVGDDIILVQQEQPGLVIGTNPELTRYHMEIRGLGIINIKDLFGAASVRERKRIELVIELVEWAPDAEYDRLGLDTHYTHLAGVPVAHIRLPVRPGRSLRLIVEVAARNRLLQAQGTHSARAFAARLDGFIQDATEEHDVE
ncbi:HPr(Ser) kinase/phosphatase [Myxococcota bacterium]|nr:HPr(Ser) kinase/phosphatase [Myxococcota bacterium]